MNGINIIILQKDIYILFGIHAMIKIKSKTPPSTDSIVPKHPMTASQGYAGSLSAGFLRLPVQIQPF